MRVGSQIGASAVILHPGSAKTGEVKAAIFRAAETIGEALQESEGCPLHLENTAGAGGTLGRSTQELAALLDACGADERLGLCLDSCHLLASGYDIRTAAGVDGLLEDISASIGLARVGSLHLNDSKAPAGIETRPSRQHRRGRARVGRLAAAFLSAPAFAELPCVLETPGEDRSGPSREEVALARTLRERGLAARG